MKARGLTQKWLVENIIKEGQKFKSLQQQVSRWLGKKREPVGEGYRNRVEDALDITVKQLPDGNWAIYPKRRIEKAYEDVNRAKMTTDRYKEEGPTLDDLPELVRLKSKLEELIDELIKSR